MDNNDISVQEAAATLNSNLTEEERSVLLGIKHEINASIRWGRVVQEAFGPILESMESVIFSGGKGLVKNNYGIPIQAPVDSLFDAERLKLEEGDKAQLFRHFVVLSLTKKLLGALKTKTNQALADIRTLSFEEEFDALCVLENESISNDVRDAVIEAEFSQEDPEVSQPSDEELTAHLDLVRGEWDCKHVRTKVRRVKAIMDGEKDRLETFCKDCRNIINVVVLQTKKKAGTPKECEHRFAEWVPGKEGHTAKCADRVTCTHLITAEIELKKIRWAEAGLEPYGDDPEQDEVTVLWA